MSLALIRAGSDHSSGGPITFCKLHIIATASEDVNRVRGHGKEAGPTLKGMRSKLLRNPKRTQSRRLPGTPDPSWPLTPLCIAHSINSILGSRVPYHSVSTSEPSSGMHSDRCAMIINCKVKPMRAITKMMRRHLYGITAWVRADRKNGYLKKIVDGFTLKTEKPDGIRS